MAEQQPEEILLDNHETITKPLGTLPSKQAKDFVRVYGTIVTVSSNSFDMSLIFGQPIIDNPNDPYIELKVAVTMSWHAAKAFAGLLIRTIQNYEEQVGEIRLPSALRQLDEPVSE